MKKSVDSKFEFIMTSKGSLGLLALGDVGLREWRKFKKSENQKITDNLDEKK